MLIQTLQTVYFPVLDCQFALSVAFSASALAPK